MQLDAEIIARRIGIQVVCVLLIMFSGSG